MTSAQTGEAFGNGQSNAWLHNAAQAGNTAPGVRHETVTETQKRLDEINAGIAVLKLRMEQHSENRKTPVGKKVAKPALDRRCLT